MTRSTPRRAASTVILLTRHAPMHSDSIFSSLLTMRQASSGACFTSSPGTLIPTAPSLPGAATCKVARRVSGVFCDSLVDFSSSISFATPWCRKKKLSSAVASGCKKWPYAKATRVGVAERGTLLLTVLLLEAPLECLSVPPRTVFLSVDTGGNSTKPRPHRQSRRRANVPHVCGSSNPDIVPFVAAGRSPSTGCWATGGFCLPMVMLERRTKIWCMQKEDICMTCHVVVVFCFPHSRRGPSSVLVRWCSFVTAADVQKKFAPSNILPDILFVGVLSAFCADKQIVQ